ncbi:MAG: hypothetical protein SPG27_14405, partial [Butyricimonas virosa]|nr:hypothetical protein [Butyricimonas virosa]
QEALLWAEGDEETLELVNQLTPDNVTMEHIIARNTIMQKYGYDMMVKIAMICTIRKTWIKI